MQSPKTHQRRQHNGGNDERTSHRHQVQVAAASVSWEDTASFDSHHQFATLLLDSPLTLTIMTTKTIKDLTKYENKWVALVKERIVAAGKDAFAAHQQALKRGYKDFTLFKVLPFDGYYIPHHHEV